MSTKLLESVSKFHIEGDIKLTGLTLEQQQPNYRVFAFHFLNALLSFDVFGFKCSELLHLAKDKWPAKSPVTRSHSAEAKDDADEIPFDVANNLVYQFLTRCLPKTYIISKSLFLNLNPAMALHGKTYTVWQELSSIMDTVSLGDQVIAIRSLSNLMQTSPTLAAFRVYQDKFVELSLASTRLRYLSSISFRSSLVVFTHNCPLLQHSACYHR